MTGGMYWARGWARRACAGRAGGRQGAGGLGARRRQACGALESAGRWSARGAQASGS